MIYSKVLSRVLLVFPVYHYHVTATASTSTRETQTWTERIQQNSSAEVTQVGNTLTRTPLRLVFDQQTVYVEHPGKEGPTTPIVPREAPAPQQEGENRDAPLGVEDPNRVLDAYDYYHTGAVNAILSCVRLRPARTRQKALQNLCRGLRREASVFQLCQHVTTRLQEAINRSPAAGLAHPFPDFFRDIGLTLQTPYLQEGTTTVNSMHLSGYASMCVSGPGAAPSVNMCDYMIARQQHFQRMLGQGSQPGENRPEHFLQAWSPRCLLLGLSFPVVEPILLGALARIVDTSQCRRTRRNWPPPPVKTGRSELLFKAWGFGISNVLFPTGLTCTADTLHPTCQTMRSHIVAVQAIMKFVRSGTFEETSITDRYLQEEADRVTPEDVQQAFIRAEIHLAELASLALASVGKTTRVGLWLLRSRTLRKLLGRIVLRVARPLRRLGFVRVEQRAREEGLEDLFATIKEALLVWAGAAGKCMTASSEFQNLLVDTGTELVSRIRASPLPQQLEQSRFLQVKWRHTSGRHTVPVVSLIEESVHGRQARGRPWYKVSRAHVSTLFVGLVLSTFLLGTLFVPVIAPLYFLFLGLGIIGFSIFVVFTIIVLQQKILVNVTREGVEVLSQRRHKPGADQSRHALLSEESERQQLLQEEVAG